MKAYVDRCSGCMRATAEVFWDVAALAGMGTRDVEGSRLILPHGSP